MEKNIDELIAEFILRHPNLDVEEEYEFTLHSSLKLVLIKKGDCPLNHIHLICKDHSPLGRTCTSCEYYYGFGNMCRKDKIRIYDWEELKRAYIRNQKESMVNVSM